MDGHLKSSSEALSHRLSSEGLLDAISLRRADALACSESLTLDQAAIQMGLVEDRQILPIAADVANCAYIDEKSEIATDADRVACLTSVYCETRVICPVKDSAGVPMVLTADPLNNALNEEIAFHLDEEVRIAAAPTRLIKRLLANTGGTNIPPEEITSPEQRDADIETLRRVNADGPVIRFVTEVFNEAVAVGASDVHFEAQEDGLRLRFRKHGALVPQRVDRSLSVSSVLARVKVLASMSVSERRLPQDGRITAVIAGRKIDFRVSSVPTSYGESIVCRILDPKSLRLGWDKLGFDKATADSVISLIEQPSGLFLVTGPTGSGKTTTLYTALTHLNREDRKIVTIEDPVEYNLAGIEQVQVHEEIGMTFATALRAFLRQDPNIIMVGEIRDQETAEIACRAALVGRLVLSTLHTNSARGAIARLVDLGVPDFIVKDVLRGVLGQNLNKTAGGQVLETELVALS